MMKTVADVNMVFYKLLAKHSFQYNFYADQEITATNGSSFFLSIQSTPHSFCRFYTNLNHDHSPIPLSAMDHF
eukprot:955639-Ditylum_brightwellii.AAC.1